MYRGVAGPGARAAYTPVGDERGAKLKQESMGENHGQLLQRNENYRGSPPDFGGVALSAVVASQCREIASEAARQEREKRKRPPQMEVSPAVAAFHSEEERQNVACRT